jgi:hypothetical protein
MGRRRRVNSWRAAVAPLLASAPLAAGALLAACAHGRAEPAVSGYGVSREKAVEVCLANGEQLYLGRLRCPGGEVALVASRASIGNRTTPRDGDDPRMLEQLDAGRLLQPGEPDLHIVDRFVLSCPDGDREVFLDMYHCQQAPPERAVEGLTLAR